MTERAIDMPAEKYYRSIHMDIQLADSADVVLITDRFIKEIKQRDMLAVLSMQNPGTSVPQEAGTALLKVDEIDRRIETVEHRRRYGRTSLTQMRGRKLSDVPVITLQTTLIDAQSGQTVFQADYVMQGPWYANSATVAAALPGTLMKQLEQEGFIATKDN